MFLKRLIVLCWCFVFACSPKETETTSVSDPNSFLDFTLRSDGVDNTQKVFDTSSTKFLSLDFAGYPTPEKVLYSWRDETGREISRNSFLEHDEVLGLREVSVFATVVKQSGEEITKRFENIRIEPKQNKLATKVIDERNHVLVLALNEIGLRRRNMKAEEFNFDDYEMVNLCIEPEFNGEMDSPFTLMSDPEDQVIMSEQDIINPYGQKLNYEWYLNGQVVPDVLTYRFPKSLLEDGDELKVIVYSEDFIPLKMKVDWNQSSSDS